MNITIKRRKGEVIIEGDFDNISAALNAAVKKGANLSYADLNYAKLRDVKLSYVDLRNAKLRNADLSYADLRNADLSYADLRNADLSYADLRNADLRDAKLSYADLRNADLSYADLSYTDLSNADLSYADLNYAKLRDVKLSYVDLRNAKLPYAPKITNLDQRILEAIKNGGCLNMSEWHTCETTHCRAGWAIHLAGEAGKVLESVFGPSVAGALIYAASTGIVPNFMSPNSEAMDSIKRSAETLSK